MGAPCPHLQIPFLMHNAGKVRGVSSPYNAWRLLPVDVVFAGVAAGLWSVKHEIQREGSCTQRKLQPEGPIPGRKLVRKMTVCACTRRNPACDGAPPLRKKIRALSPPTRCWLCRGAVAISRAGSYKKQIMGIKRCLCKGAL